MVLLTCKIAGKKGVHNMAEDTVVAVTGKLIDLQSVVDSDNLLQATVVCGKHGKWRGVVNRASDFQVGTLVEVYLQDALLPETDARFAFMASRKYRVAIARFRGALSECLIMPLSHHTVEMYEPGINIMAVTGCQKYVKDNIDPRQALGAFPGNLPKTDEVNLQAAELPFGGLVGRPYVATMKWDGTSTTAFAYMDEETQEMRICSRNLIVKGGEHWVAAKRYPKLETYLRDHPAISLQWETVGPSIQKNPAKLAQVEGRMFLAFDKERQMYLSFMATTAIAWEIGMPMVDLVDMGDHFDLTEEEIAAMVNGHCYPGTSNQIEGVVFRYAGEMERNGKIGFKYISPDYRN
jgi:hypothetical protein